MVVVDASVVVDFLLREDEHGEWATTQLRSARSSLHAPTLVDYEVLAGVRRSWLRGVTSGRCRRALADFADLRLTRHSPRRSLERAWRLRDTLTAYDAAYVALAESLGCPLVTTDLRLARAQGHAAVIVGPET